MQRQDGENTERRQGLSSETDHVHFKLYTVYRARICKLLWSPGSLRGLQIRAQARGGEGRSNVTYVTYSMF
jgi:hypothetical protein